MQANLSRSLRSIAALGFALIAAAGQSLASDGKDYRIGVTGMT